METTKTQPHVRPRLTRGVGCNGNLTATSSGYAVNIFYLFILSFSLSLTVADTPLTVVLMQTLTRCTHKVSGLFFLPSIHASLQAMLLSSFTETCSHCVTSYFAHDAYFSILFLIIWICKQDLEKKKT